MSGRLSGKVVVVTGAARGMGRAQALALAREGADVVAADVLDAELADLVSASGRIEVVHLDVTDEAGWAALADRVRGAHGRLDALVNNAGVASRGRLPEVEPAQLRAVMDVNVVGPLLGMQLLRPLLVRGSSIVNVVSVAGLAGHVAAAYTASKWALRGLSRAAALEFGEAGIRVNAIFPGFVDTSLMADASAAFRAAAVAETPLGRVGTPEDVAPLVVYLVSDESAFVTGAEIAVDGGLTSHVSHKRIADAIGRG